MYFRKIRIMSIRMLTFSILAITAVTSAAMAADSAEGALAIAVKQPNLVWGPCPPIFPKGCRIAVLHGDPGQPNADVFLQVPSKYKIPAHWHTSPERMVLVTGRLKVAYDGQAPAVLKTGNYAYGPAKLPHSAECQSKEPCTLFIAFEGAVDAHVKE